jgi:hypothetical protein
MPSKHDNLSNEMLADEIGRLDAIAKAAEKEISALNEEFKRRGLTSVCGERTEVTATEQTPKRLDAAKVRAFFGSVIAQYETSLVSTVILVKPAVASLDALIAA